MVLQGKLRTIVRWLTKRKKGGVYHPQKILSNVREPILDILQSNHSELRTTLSSIIEK